MSAFDQPARRIKKRFALLKEFEISVAIMLIFNYIIEMKLCFDYVRLS